MPVVEGWLTEVCLLGVSASYIKIIWKRLYQEKSSRDSGTLVQLRNLNRKTVPKDPKNQVHASEDFLKVICIAQVIAAAMAVL